MPTVGVPPRWAARLLRWSLGDNTFADSVIGDLTEEWTLRIERRARYNGLWYWGQALSIGVRLVFARLTSARVRKTLGSRERDGVASQFRAGISDCARGLRIAGQHRGLFAVAAMSIALGIASPTTIFSIVHGLSRDLPFPQGERIVYVTQADTKTGERDLGLTQPVFTALVAQQRALEDIAAFVEAPVSLVDGDTPAERYDAVRISPSAFALLRVRPMIGVGFTVDDARERRDVAMIGDAVWRRRFGSAGDIIGRTIRINGRPTRIVGVMPPGFRFPLKDELWLPLDVSPTVALGAVNAFGRLRAGVSVENANAEFAALTTRVVRDPSTPDQRLVTRVLPFKESQLEPSDIQLFRAMVLVVSMVLLVASANVANLLLAHVMARSQLYAVKTAIGASRGAVVREILAESAAMAFAGGALGVMLAAAAIHWFNDSVSDVLPSFWMDVTIDGRVLVFVVGLVVLAAVVAGLVPALHASSNDPSGALRQQSAGSLSRTSARAMRVLLTIEVGVSFALLVVAGLMTKGALRGSRSDLSVDAKSIMTARIDLDVLARDSERTQFASQLFARAATDGRLADLAFTTVLPGLNGASTRFAMSAPTPSREADLPRTRLAVVSPGYFDVLHVRVLQGRVLRESDVAHEQRVAVVNSSFVRAHLARRSAIGARLQLRSGADSSWLTIVGVIPDLTTVSTDPSANELLVVPFAQQPVSGISALAGGTRGAAVAAAALRDLVHEVSADVPLSKMRALDEAIAQSRRASWSLADVFAECGLAGLILTTVGVYGVAATTSRRRLRELAIRLALGSSRTGILGLIARDAALSLAIGLAVGSGVALVVGSSLQDLLFGVSPRDPIAFGVVAASIAVAMLLAIVQPAVSVVRTPLVETLRR